MASVVISSISDRAPVFEKQEITLTPKTSAVLKELVTHAGRPVTKEELFASVWKGTVVSDDALTSSVQELRKAFADDAVRMNFTERSAI